MTPTGDQSADGGIVQRVEVLLSSLTAVVSAKVILDQETGAHVHVLATAEVPVSEVSRAVTSVLTLGLGYEVPADQITVVQSRLSRKELTTLLGSESTAPPSAEVSTEEPASNQPHSKSTASQPHSKLPASQPHSKSPAVQPHPLSPAGRPRAEPSARPPGPKAVPDPGLMEFSLGRSAMVTKRGPAPEIQRLELQDLQLNKNPQGGFDVLLRLTGNDRSIGAQRGAAGTAEDSLEVPASAALDVIQEFLRSDREHGVEVLLRFLAAQRVRSAEHDVVVVLVEADVGGRRIPLTGAASAYRGVERASILATLQATNEFVASTLMAESTSGVSAQ